MRSINGKNIFVNSNNSCYDEFLTSIKLLEETNILQTCYDEKRKMLSIVIYDENGKIITIEIDLSDIDTHLTTTISKIRLLTVNLKNGSVQFVLINNHIHCSKITYKCGIVGFYHEFHNDVKFLVLSTNGNLIAVRITNDSFKFANEEIQIDRIRFFHYSKKNNNTFNFNNTKYYSHNNNDNNNNDDGGLGNNLNYDNKKDNKYIIEK